VFEVKNESNKVIRDSKFATYLPIESAHQRVGNLRVSQNYSVVKSDDGNRVLETKFDLLPPYGVKKISISADITSISSAKASSVVPGESYLKAEKYIEVEDEKIVAIAKQLSGDTKKQTATNIYNWVTNNLGNSGYTSQDKGALFALESGKGDCTEFMYLTIALARASGIYARGVGGYVYPQSTLVKSADYHNWAELYFDDKWHVIDSQKKVFSDQSGDYISIRHLSDKKVSLLGTSHRFSVIDESLKVKML
jgi:transglutaminase-like putative cysteine protease